MWDLIEDANEEIKRVDHLVYVTLKYTRTVDVLQTIISRMVDGYEFLIKGLIHLAQHQKKYHEEIPNAPLLQCNVANELYKDDEMILDNVALYMLLRKVKRSKVVEKQSEFRRHVAMITIIDNQEELINIDIVSQYYLMLKDFHEYVKAILKDSGINKEVNEDDGWY